MNQLDAGSLFPSMTLKFADGGQLILPSELDTQYLILLFFRGHW
jgi:peroxiredoxin